MPDLLLELYSEEIPARMQRDAAAGLKALVCKKLSESGIQSGEAAAYATPRRVCIAVKGLPESSPVRKTERKGPREDAPEKALSGFSRSTGVSRENLELREEKKGRYYFAVMEVPGQPLPEIVTGAVQDAIREFVWPKSMVWGTGQLRWVRPLHSILCILHDETGCRTVDFEIEGIRAGGTTRGHRLMSASEFQVASFDDYKAKLEQAFVILDPEDRKERIREGAERLAKEKGLHLVDDPELLDENAGLTEWPVPMIGVIDDRFLDLPNELLTAAMKQHQKYHSAADPDTGKVTHFVMVADRETKDKGEAMLAGNMRVLNSRLDDAEFYWKNDLRTVETDGLKPLEEKLRRMNFHNKLGNMEQRVSRIASISEILADTISVKAADACLAARLSKTDLVTETVGEFPELQGKVGRKLAGLSGYGAPIADACEQHYLPAGPSDSMPSEPLAVAVGLADRIDYLAAFFSIGETPSGSKDPHGLRRAAIGVIRLILDNNIRIRLLDALDFALNQYSEFPAVAPSLNGGPKFARLKMEVLNFVNERLAVYMRDAGIRQDCVKACVRVHEDDTLDCMKKRGADDLVLVTNHAAELGLFIDTDDGLNFVTAFKRVNNILASEERKGVLNIHFSPERKIFQEPEEGSLLDALERMDDELSADSINIPVLELVSLSSAIDDFFDRVLVNSTDRQVRLNRLRLLRQVRETCMEIVDFRQINT